ncbi:MAG: hypothetical protein SNJ59_11530 [Aggregatilineales bacterium]
MKHWFLFIVFILTLGVWGGAAAQEAPPLSPALEAQLDRLIVETEALRSLPTLRPVERAFPTRAETIDYLRQLYATELTDGEVERARLFYAALGLLPPTINLRETLLDLLGGQIGGFYDTSTGVMNVIPMTRDNPGDGLTLTEQIVFVHEYVHALQDQHFGLDRLDDPALALEPDAYLALLSLVEGDATAVMQLYAQDAIARNPAAAFGLVLEGLASGTLFIPPGTPDILVRELLFPYEEGLNFVLALYLDGGWERVNAAFDNPPTTSAQIIDPAKYLAGIEAVSVEASPVSAEAVLGPGWRQAVELTVGEFYLREHLRTAIAARPARAAAAGWAGDRLQIFHQPATDAMAFLLRVIWEAPAEAAEFNQIYAEFAAAAFGAPTGDGCWTGAAGAACIAETKSAETLIAQAPTLDGARALRAAAA